MPNDQFELIERAREPIHPDYIATPLKLIPVPEEFLLLSDQPEKRDNSYELLNENPTSKPAVRTIVSSAVINPTTAQQNNNGAPRPASTYPNPTNPKSINRIEQATVASPPELAHLTNQIIAPTLSPEGQKLENQLSGIAAERAKYEQNIKAAKDASIALRVAYDEAITPPKNAAKAAEIGKKISLIQQEIMSSVITKNNIWRTEFKIKAELNVELTNEQNVQESRRHQAEITLKSADQIILNLVDKDKKSTSPYAKLLAQTITSIETELTKNDTLDLDTLSLRDLENLALSSELIKNRIKDPQGFFNQIQGQYIDVENNAKNLGLEKELKKIDLLRHEITVNGKMELIKTFLEMNEDLTLEIAARRSGRRTNGQQRSQQARPQQVQQSMPQRQTVAPVNNTNMSRPQAITPNLNPATTPIKNNPLLRNPKGQITSARKEQRLQHALHSKAKNTTSTSNTTITPNINPTRANYFKNKPKVGRHQNPITSYNRRQVRNSKRTP